MSNIRKEYARHVWRETTLVRGVEKFPGSLICLNCRKPHYSDQEGDPPVAGCPVETDLSKASDSRLAQQRDYEMAQRSEETRREKEFLGDWE